LYFKYNIFIYNGDNWKPGFMALPCFLFTNLRTVSYTDKMSWSAYEMNKEMDEWIDW
jgi:hypothetical protein